MYFSKTFIAIIWLRATMAGSMARQWALAAAAAAESWACGVSPQMVKRDGLCLRLTNRRQEFGYRTMKSVIVTDGRANWTSHPASFGVDPLARPAFSAAVSGARPTASAHRPGSGILVDLRL